MYKCSKCDKEFKYESDYNRHNKRKTACIKINDNFKCELCKLNFKFQSKLQTHEKTKNHIFNIQNSTINNSFNNVINLTLNVNSFKKTDTTIIRRSIINDIGENIYLEIMNDNLSIIDKVKKLFDTILEILEKLHFNLDIEENHNLKILLVFPGIKKAVYEYLILDINPETKNIIWNAINYEELMKQIFYHLYNLNNKIQNNNYDKFIIFLEKYIVKNKDIANKLKPFIENKLGKLYLEFNKRQKKENRSIQGNFTEKLVEYKYYRDNECKLNNGFNPKIINYEIQ
jgi:hypothetical protein